MAALCNPYLSFFESLPPAYRNTAAPGAFSVESPAIEWLALKAAIARHFAWAVPTDEAIACIARHAASVIEIGAGSGYWAWLLRQAGIDALAVDADPPAFTWGRVEVGDERALAGQGQRALLLCWPPWGSTMAAQALRRHEGRLVIYVGEWLSGCADADFFRLLVDRFEAVDGVELPRWAGRCDALSVFRRRGAA